MSNISTYSATAASNNSASPNGFPEGMAPSGLNDSAREVMAALAKWYAALKGALVTTGSSNAYVLTTGSAHASLAAIGLIVFRVNFSNTATCTLAVDGLTAKTLKWQGAVLPSGALLLNNIYTAVWNPQNDCYDIVSGVVANLSALNTPIRDARTSNTILGVSDIGKLIDITSGTFSQTFAAAATLGSGWFVYIRNGGTGLITLDPDGSETIEGAATLILKTGESALVTSNGSNLFALVASRNPGDHVVEVHTGNGHGSTNNKIRRFTTAMTETGTAITYADSAANGGSFTINHAGLYAIHYSDARASNPATIGITVNSAALTTSVVSVPVATRKAFISSGTNLTDGACLTCVIKLAVSDIVRAHTDGNPDGTADTVFFSIRKIANY